MKKIQALETRLIKPRTGNHGHRSLACPIYQTATYENRFMETGAYSYTRCSNPTRHELEETAASAEGGRHCSAFSSGLAAIDAVFSLVPPGKAVLASRGIYGGTCRLLSYLEEYRGVKVIYADSSDDEAFRAAFTPEIGLVFIETPSNPLMKMTDIAAVSRLVGGRATVVCDNTFLTPVFQLPLELGADAVVHSATKYLCGHHDTSAGLVVTSDKAIADKLRCRMMTAGAGLAPFDSFLVRRGMETLVLRMERHAENAKKVFAFLKNRPEIGKIYFPGDPGHPQKELICRQTRGCGGMISFELNGIDPGAFIGRLRLITFAESLGGNASLITHPYTQTHASLPEETRLACGITPALLRLSVGTEAAEDIVEDLKNAFIPLA